ncbi:uncharacterized protein [Henckelia pumila]|uniref:uncharacterized protein isoform X2 n=1 Tax=Henckelia pumila TaxID=405737 RepID=UPI003C6E90C6
MEESAVKYNHEVKLKELLRNFTSADSNLFADSSKQFTRILGSDSGAEFIRVYVGSSSKLVELWQAWESWKTKPEFLHVLKLVSEILKHHRGKVSNDVGRVLDKCGRVLIEEKMGDLYKELNSKEGKRQNAVIFLLASIVRRSSYLAWEVAKIFDFKLPFFSKLAEVRLRGKQFGKGNRKSSSTRKSFVGFAMAFLEVGYPRLLRGILQQKEMYSGVLRGLGNDDEQTVIYVLSILRDRVLVPDSLVPTGLRSVLFGSVTLEQLISISGRNDFGDATKLAHEVLVLVCTDPLNGLMPDLKRHPSPLFGNRKRLLDLMKKLKATEVEYHLGLLLAIVKVMPSFGSAYLDEFPYNIEDLSSADWLAAVSMAADVVSSVSDGLTLGFADHQEPLAFECPYVQNVLKCIVPRPFTRLVINKGLLHWEPLVKHGTLRLVLVGLNLLDSFLSYMGSSVHSNNKMIQKWDTLKTNIENEVRILLPDPQVLLSLLSPLSNQLNCLTRPTKRKCETEIVPEKSLYVSKRMKNSAANEDIDILVGGVSDVDMSWVDQGSTHLSSEQGLEKESDVKSIGILWGLHQCSMADVNNCETYFYSKLLDTLKIYHRTMPMALEGLFDFFRFLPSNPLSLPTILQLSLLQFLSEHVCQFSRDMCPVKTQTQMYKHLHSFIVLLMYSPVREIKEHAYNLAKAAMSSTGAFDNSREICAWFSFIPGYGCDHAYVSDVVVEILQKLSSVIISFLCDAVSTIGNNLCKYIEFLRHYTYDAEGGRDLSPDVSPFIICVLEKCIRLVSSESVAFTLPQKSLISQYVCNTIKYLLDTQVNSGLLSSLIDRLLSEKLESLSSAANVLELDECPCVLRPLKTLLCLSRKMLHRQSYRFSSNVVDVTQSSYSFMNTLSVTKRILRKECDSDIIGLAVRFSSSLICARHIEILQNFPLVLCISRNLCEVPFSVVASIFFLEPSYLTDVFNLWPDMFISGVQSVIHGRDEDEEKLGTVEFDSMEAASIAFAFYLKHVPFCVIFSAILQSSSLHLFEQSALQKFLLAKLTEMPPDHMVSSLCNVLFWINDMRSPHRVRTFDGLEVRSEICFILAEDLLRQLLVQNLDIDTPTHISGRQPLHYAVEVAEIILNHPAVTELLNFPVSGDISGSIFKGNLEILLELAEQGIQRMDHHVLNLLRTSNQLLFKICSGQRSERDLNASRRILRAFKVQIQKLFLVFKNEFDGCIQLMDFKALLPMVYTLHTLICFISPFDLFELVNWLFSKVDLCDTSWPLFAKEDALCVGLHLASCAFDFLLGNMLHLCSKNKDNIFLGAIEEMHLNLSLLEQIFFQVFEMACIFNLDAADKCLLKAVKVVKMHKGIQQPCISSIMDLLVVVACSSVDMISHCLNRMNKTKAELLFLVAELSPLHLSIFGHLFSETMKNSLLPVADWKQKDCISSLSDEELLMLLPTVFLYVNSIESKFGGEHETFEHIIFLYKRKVLDGFSDWKTFVSGNIFEMEFGESTPSSFQEFLTIFSNSLLGKTIHVFREHLETSGGAMNFERRLNLFDSVCPYASAARDHLFDCYCDESGLPSVAESLDYVNRVVAKINFCRVLLLPDYNQFQRPDNGEEKVTSEVDSAVEKSRIRFLRILINSWTLMVKKSSANMGFHENIKSQNISSYTFLEIFIICNILNLTAEWHNHLIRLSSLPFIEQLVKSFLLYRFEDPTTVKMVRTVLTSLTWGKFSSDSFMQLLLAHSQFAKLITPSYISPSCAQLGLSFTPMTSILKSLTFFGSGLDPVDCKNNILTSQRRLHLLELVKLVRVLFNINVQHNRLNCGEGIGVQSKELIYLLLTSYGALCNDVDVEIYSLISEIESNDQSCAGTVAQMDYLWGIASLRVRKDWEKDEDTRMVSPETVEVLEEGRKIRFRENLPVDPKLCAQTVLYFPYDRCVNGRTLLEFQKDDSTVGHSTTADKLQIYDPVFILRFSIHCLSVGYIEPIEFANLGLLAITFVSMSSPDDNMRKLAYEALAKFKYVLEKCKKKQHVAQLRLLVLYVQNGIDEQWQRIPSIIAVFIAEASLVLLDPSHDNYSTISKFLMNSPCVNMRIIPLFENLFWSSSVSFRNDRLWILRLLYAGLNVEDDAQIFIQNSTFEKIFGFYSSPLSDNDSQELIIQIVKKAVKLHKLACNLVEQCGIILWLSSIVSSHCWGEFEDRKRFISTQLPIIMEVLNAITLPRKIVEWLQKRALEQLSELSSHLYKLLVGGIITEQSSVGNSIMQLLTFVLKISQKRKIYQPHFTLTETGLFQLCEAIDIRSKTSCDLSMILGLEAVLMSAPPINILRMDHKNLLKLLQWSVTIAVQSNSMGMLQSEDSEYHLINLFMKKQDEVSLASKLLRWLTASVILGNISSKLSKFNSAILLERSSLRTLQSLLEFNEQGFGEDVGCDSKDVLATSIIYLLQLVGFSHSLLPSAVAALCLLLRSGSSSGSEFLDGYGISLPSLCTKIPCPVEANPSWRWSFYQPWRDHSLELNALEKLDEIHACEKLLKIASIILGRRKSSSSHFFTTKDLEKFHVYEWERSIFLTK